MLKRISITRDRCHPKSIILMQLFL